MLAFVSGGTCNGWGMKTLIEKLLTAWTGFSLGQMIASAVVVVGLAGGIPMGLLAWAAVRTSHATGDTQESVQSMRDGLDEQLSRIASDVTQVKLDVASMKEKTTGLEGRLLQLESQRSGFVSVDTFRAEVNRLSERIADVREELPGRRRSRTEDPQ